MDDSKCEMSTCVDVDQTYQHGVNINLKPGMAWLLYFDDGPSGPCGQSMRITCPHAKLMIWPNEDLMRAALNGAEWRAKKPRIMFGVVDAYTAGGVFTVIGYTALKGE